MYCWTYLELLWNPSCWSDSKHPEQINVMKPWRYQQPKHSQQYQTGWLLTTLQIGRMLFVKVFIWNYMYDNMHQISTSCDRPSIVDLYVTMSSVCWWQNNVINVYNHLSDYYIRIHRRITCKVWMCMKYDRDLYLSSRTGMNIWPQ